MSTTLSRGSQATGLRAWIEAPDVRAQLTAAVGDVMDPEQFIAHSLVAFQNEKVRGCTDESKFRALHELAALGMVPTTGQVSLIPYKQEIKVQVEWRGMKALMERHEDVLEVTGHLVHVTDHIAIENGEMCHQYDPYNKDRSIDGPEDLKGGYCKIVYRDGRPPRYHTVTIEYISKCQKCAQTQKIWSAWYEQMALKTLYRDTYKRGAVPMDPLVQARFERALEIEDVNLGNDPLRVLPNPHIEQARELRAAEDAPKEAEEDTPDPTPEDLPKTLHADNKADPAADLDALVEQYGQAFEGAKSEAQIEKIHTKALAEELLAGNVTALKRIDKYRELALGRVK